MQIRDADSIGYHHKRTWRRIEGGNERGRRINIHRSVAKSNVSMKRYCNIFLFVLFPFLIKAQGTLIDSLRNNFLNAPDGEKNSELQDLSTIIMKN